MGRPVYMSYTIKNILLSYFTMGYNLPWESLWPKNLGLPGSKFENCDTRTKYNLYLQNHFCENRIKISQKKNNKKDTRGVSYFSATLHGYNMEVLAFESMLIQQHVILFLLTLSSFESFTVNKRNLESRSTTVVN